MHAVALRTPPLPLLVRPETFDGFAWCESRTLGWRAPAPVIVNAFEDTLPLRMAFVFEAPFAPLPAEYAWLHTGRDQAAAVGLDDTALALAPYALDDATDLLWAHRRPPAEVFSLVADNLNAVFWALHDWSHFHNHGDFTDRVSTELQCDAAALVWLYLNRNALVIDAPTWERYRQAALDNHLKLRALEPDSPCGPPRCLEDPAWLKALADAMAM